MGRGVRLAVSMISSSSSRWGYLPSIWCGCWLQQLLLQQTRASLLLLPLLLSELALVTTLLLLAVVSLLLLLLLVAAVAALLWQHCQNRLADLYCGPAKGASKLQHQQQRQQQQHPHQHLQHYQQQQQQQPLLRQQYPFHAPVLLPAQPHSSCCARCGGGCWRHRGLEAKTLRLLLLVSMAQRLLGCLKVRRARDWDGGGDKRAKRLHVHVALVREQHMSRLVACKL